MFRWLRKRRAIRAYQRGLGPQLRARHGNKRHYTPEEVHGTIRAGGLSDVFHCFALAMYCDMFTLNAYHHAEGVVCDYGAMRSECDVGAFQGADFVDTGYFDHGSADHGSADHGASDTSWSDHASFDSGS